MTSTYEMHESRNSHRRLVPVALLLASAALAAVTAVLVVLQWTRDSAVESLVRLVSDVHADTPLFCCKDRFLEEVASLDPCIEAVQRAGAQELTLHSLVQMTHHHDERVRANAVYVLGKLNDSAAEAIPALATALQDENNEVRLVAVIALSNFQGHAEQRLPLLMEAFRSCPPQRYRNDGISVDEDYEQLRRWALVCLASINRNAADEADRSARNRKRC